MEYHVILINICFKLPQHKGLKQQLQTLELDQLLVPELEVVYMKPEIQAKGQEMEMEMQAPIQLLLKATLLFLWLE